MKISIELNEENSKRLSVLRDIGILDIDLDSICNDAIKEQLDNAANVLDNWSSHFEHGR